MRLSPIYSTTYSPWEFHDPGMEVRWYHIRHILEGPPINRFLSHGVMAIDLVQTLLLFLFSQ